MNESLKCSTSASLREDPAAIVAAIEAQSTVHKTPCGDGHMVWRRWGSGPPVVLIHGGGGAWSHWIRNVEALAHRHTVWVPDLPGLGESALVEPLSVEAISAAVERGLRMLIPGEELIDLVGFSFGTSIATVVAARLQNRLCNLVLVAAKFVLHPKQSRPRLESWRKIEDSAGRLAVHRQNLEIFMIADPNNIDDLAIYVQSTNAERARFSGSMLNPSSIDKMHEYLPQVRARGQVTGISGRKDQGASPIMDKQESALQAIQPHARFCIIENAGHWVSYEAAEQFNKLLLDALSVGVNRRKPDQIL